MSSVLKNLCAPFHPSRVTWKPGAMTKDKSKAMAMAYADLRAYQNRLDEVCGMDWSLTYTPWGDRIICHLTINGVTRSATGEGDSDSERNENAGTSAEAQAMKRACAMFGLGRYLYNLPSTWVEYDAENRRFTEQAKAKLHGIIQQHYQRFLDGRPMPEGAAASTEPSELDALGISLYGDRWPQVRASNVRRLTGKEETALTADHIQTLLGGLRKVQEQRQPA